MELKFQLHYLFQTKIRNQEGSNNDLGTAENIRASVVPNFNVSKLVVVYLESVSTAYTPIKPSLVVKLGLLKCSKLVVDF